MPTKSKQENERAEKRIADAYFAWRNLKNDAAAEIFVKEVLLYYYPAARRICNNRNEAADALQEAFLQLVIHHKKRRRPKNISAWLTRVIINICINAKKTEGFNEDMRSNYIPQLRDDENPEDRYESDRATLLRKALQVMPRNLRECLELSYLDEVKGTAAAKLLKIDLDDYYRIVHRARKFVRDYFERSMKPVSDEEIDQLMKSRINEPAPDELKASILGTLLAASTASTSASSTSAGATFAGRTVAGARKWSRPVFLVTGAAVALSAAIGIYILTKPKGVEWTLMNGYASPTAAPNISNAGAPRIVTNRRKPDVAWVSTTMVGKVALRDPWTGLHAPFNGAVVTAHLAGMPNSTAVTDPTGTYQLPIGDFTKLQSIDVIAAQANYTKTSVTPSTWNMVLAPGYSTMADVLLEQASVVSGEITFEGNEPAADVEVTIESLTTGIMYHGLAGGTDHSFAIANVPNGKYQIHAASGFAVYDSPAPVDIDAHVAASNILITFPKTVSRTFQIRFASNAPGGDIVAAKGFALVNQNGTLIATVDTDGKFTVPVRDGDASAPSNLNIRGEYANTHICYPLTASDWTSLFDTGSTTVPALFATHVVLQNVPASAVVTPESVILKTGMIPIGADQIVVNNNNSTSLDIHYSSQGQSNVQFWIQPKGMAPVRVTVAPGQESAVFDAGQGGTISGTLFASDNAYAKQAAVLVYLGRNMIAAVPTSDAGEFNIPNMPKELLTIFAVSAAGSYQTAVIPSLLGPDNGLVQSVADPVVMQPLNHIQIGLSPGFVPEMNLGIASGVLTDANYRPQSGQLYRSQVRTDEILDIGWLPTGLYSCIGYSRPGASAPDSKVTRFFTISTDSLYIINTSDLGTLTLTLSGQAELYTYISAVLLNNKFPYFSTAEVNSDGSLKFENVPAGNYDIWIIPRGGAPVPGSLVNQSVAMSKDQIHEGLGKLKLDDLNVSVIGNTKLTTPAIINIKTGILQIQPEWWTNCGTMQVCAKTSTGRVGGASLREASSTDKDKLLLPLPVGSYCLIGIAADGSTKFTHDVVTLPAK